MKGKIKERIILMFITLVITFIFTTLLILSTVKITNIENGNITINILGIEQIYYFEK